VLGWLIHGFGLTIKFIGSSLVVTTNNCNTFKITIIITHKSSIHMLSLHRSICNSSSTTNLPWLSPTENRTELNCWCSSQSQSYIATDGQPVSQSVSQLSLGVEPHLRLVTRYLLFFDSYRFVSCGAPSLMRGRVCLLYMLLAPASRVCCLAGDLVI
jgi:hypothetical protein